MGGTLTRRKPHTTLSVVAFESRENPAGTVTVTAAGGLLTLTGDGLANQVTIYRNGQTVGITGQSGTAVTQATATGITRITARMGANDDVLVMYNSGTQPLTNVTVDGDDGYDTITLYGIQVSGAVNVKLGRGDDSLTLSGIAGSINIDGGPGNNTVNVQLGVGTLASVTVDSAELAASGRDNITIRGSGVGTRVDSLTVRTGNQDDTVSIASLAASRIYSHGGGGTNDRISLSGISLYGERRLDFEGYELFN